MERKPLSYWIVRGTGIFLIYAVLALVITWPMATNLANTLPGASGDTLLHYWNGWATKYAISQGQSPFYTDLLFHPHGVSLVTHNMAWYQILPWLILEQFLDGIVAYNVTLLISITLCGVAAFILAYELTENWKSAFLAGLIYMAWPFRLSQLDHPNLLATQWIPIFMFFLIRTLETGRWRDVVLTAVSVALIGYGRWQLLIPAAIMGLIYVVWNWRLWWPSTRRETLLRLIAAGGMAVIFLLPPAWLLLREQMSASDATNLFREGEEAIMQSDLLAYFTPSNGHFLLRDKTEPIYDRYYAIRFNTRRYSPYIGITTLILAVIALLRRGRKAIPWLLMAVVMALLAMGPILLLNGTLYPQAPMLYRLLEPLQFIRLMRVPDRFNMFLALPAAVLAGYGSAVILHRLRTKWVENAVCGILMLLLLLEYLAIPVTLYEVPAPSPFFEELAREPGDFAVLNLPFDSLKAKNYMFEQISHQRPIVQGNLSRIPPDAYQSIESNLWLNTLRYDVEMDPTFQDVGRQLQWLADNDVRYVIMHKDLVGADRIQHWQRYLLSTPYYADEQIIVYRTEPEIGEDFTFLKELIPGLGPVRVMHSAVCVAKGHTLEVDVGWAANQPVRKDFAAELALLDNQGAVVLSDTYPLSSGYPSGQWPAQALVWGYYRLSIPKDIDSGKYELVLTLLDEAGSRIGQSFNLQEIKIQDDICEPEPIAEASFINAIFGDQLRLIAYQFVQDEKLDLRLYWQAEQRMDKDYKIFIHVFDPATGIPLAQDDAMPHRNAYPTRFWGLEEVVEDRIQIALQGVEAGTYGLAVGVYDPATGERLEVVDGQGRSVEAGRLIVPETIVVP